MELICDNSLDNVTGGITAEEIGEKFRVKSEQDLGIKLCSTLLGGFIGGTVGLCDGVRRFKNSVLKNNSKVSIGFVKIFLEDLLSTLAGAGVGFLSGVAISSALEK